MEKLCDALDLSFPGLAAATCFHAKSAGAATASRPHARHPKLDAAECSLHVAQNDMHSIS